MDASGKDPGCIPLNAVDAHVGSRLRARRLLVQVSEDWLAGFLGVSVEQLQAMEEGRLRIGNRELLLCVDALDVPERYFYLGFGSGSVPAGPKSRAREVDRWFIKHVFPHEGLMYSCALQMVGNPEVARELVQETYAEMLTGERWRSVLFPRAYALRSVRNLCTRYLQRSRIVRIELLANMESVDQTDMTPDAYEILSAKERREIVLKAIDDLPPQCRKVVKMRRLKEMLPRDIAKELGISLSAVEKNLARGMLQIADALGRHEPKMRVETLERGGETAAGE
jgi:RNA polymerase sigma-70 factor (ECF subfamily)